MVHTTALFTLSVSIAHLSFELHFPHSKSLKDKRRILKRMKDRIRNKTNVSMIESAYEDKWQRSQLEIVFVGKNQRDLEDRISRLLTLIETISIGDAQLIRSEIRWY